MSLEVDLRCSFSIGGIDQTEYLSGLFVNPLPHVVDPVLSLSGQVSLVRSGNVGC